MQLIQFILKMCTFFSLNLLKLKIKKSINNVNYGIYWENSIDQVHYELVFYCVWGKFYYSGRLLTSVLLCVVPFNVTFIAPLVTVVTYVYVFIIKWVNLEKVLKFIFINM